MPWKDTPIERRNEITRKWRETHRERHRENKRRWSQANLAKDREYHRKAYWAHPEKFSEKNHKDRLSHLEKRRERSRESTRRRRRANPGKHSQANAERDRKLFITKVLGEHVDGYHLHHMGSGLGIWIPSSLHMMIRHSLLRNRNMEQIDTAALEVVKNNWILEHGGHSP